jgi:hypothetical protein
VVRVLVAQAGLVIVQVAGLEQVTGQAPVAEALLAEAELGIAPVAEPEIVLAAEVVPEIVLAAEVVPEIVQAAEVVLETVLAAEVVLETVLVAELVLEIVLPVGEQEPVLVVVALRTKLVTVAHRRVLVAVIAEEDLAGVAETTLEPAVPEEVVAWAAAVTAVAAEGIAVVAVAVVAAVAAVVAVVAVVAAVAAVAAVAEEAGDKQMIDGEKTMKKTKRNTMTSSKMIVLAATTLITSFLVTAAVAAPEKKAAAAKQEAQGTPQPGQKQFDTPKQAADALIQVASNFDVAAAKEILGPDGDDIISSEDPVMDKNRATEFANKAKEKTSVELDKRNSNHAILLVGNDEFPLPIPIVKQNGKWFFDTKVGREEILNRRVGANELNAIEICRGFVEAQHEYAMEKHDDSKVNQYAQHILSTPGKHDGLAWQNADGTWSGPVGEEVAKALQEGYKAERGTPYHGYYFKVLTGQGPAAPMGEMNFLVGGAMIGGFGLAAAPADYRVTGVMTFIVGPDGVVYQKDLGPDTLKTFQSMDKYNPDKSWKVTEDDMEDDSSDQGSESQGQ